MPNTCVLLYANAKYWGEEGYISVTAACAEQRATLAARVSWHGQAEVTDKK